nr:hypothetical protein CFP56_51905 [Quercus suber]
MDQRSQRSLSSLGGAPFIWQVWMYEYFGVGLQVQEDVDGIYPRFLRWLPKYRLSTPSKRSLEVWCTVIDNLIVANISLNPWLGCIGILAIECCLKFNTWIPGSYFEFIQTQLQGNLADIPVISLHLLKRKRMMNPDGSYSSMTLDRPEHTPNVPWPEAVDVDPMEKIFPIHNQQNELVSQMVLVDANKRSLEERIENLELENQK